MLCHLFRPLLLVFTLNKAAELNNTVIRFHINVAELVYRLSPELVFHLVCDAIIVDNTPSRPAVILVSPRRAGAQSHQRGYSRPHYEYRF